MLLLSMLVTLQVTVPDCRLESGSEVHHLPLGVGVYELGSNTWSVVASNLASGTLADPAAGSLVVVRQAGGSVVVDVIPPEAPDVDYDWRQFRRGMFLAMAVGLPLIATRWIKRLSAPSCD